MKKWKLIMLSAVLCMMIGMQTVAAEPNVSEDMEDMAEVGNEAVDAQKSVADEQEKTQTQKQDTITTNLPVYSEKDMGNDWFFLQDSIVTFDDNSTVQINTLPKIRWRASLSQRTISQEEAKKIMGAQEDCTIIALDMELCVQEGGLPEELNGKTVTKVQATEFHVDPSGGHLGEIIHSTYKGETSLKVLYSPNSDQAFTELTVNKIGGIDGVNLFGGLKGDIPFNGATLVFIAGKPATGNSSDSSSSNSSSSDNSDRPEAYSRGETVGDIGVQKTGTAAHVRKADGTEINVIVHPYLNPGTKTLTQSQARAMLGTSYACGIYSFDLSIVNAQEDYGPVTLLDGSVPVTFIVPGVTPESKVALRHWINGSNTYEDLPVEVGNGTVRATFTSFSPVVIVVEQPGVTAAANIPTSPKTGENSVLYLAEIVALLSLLGLSVCWKERQI